LKESVVKRAIYPGSFDPVTNGHLDIVRRALEVFDHLTIAVAVNPQKRGLFSYEEREELIHEVTKTLKNVEVVRFDGLLADYCRDHAIHSVVRGMRVVSDFEYEFQMHTMNKRLNPNMETLFMMTSEQYFYLSSSLVREVATFGGSIAGLVAPIVEDRLREKLAIGREG
jgi:pantetheine-phosphate adenylyltransferase